jgi:hypothetical protein
MIFLIVGVDRRSLAPWHKNIAARDGRAAVRLACAHAEEAGCDLVVAAVVGPNSTVLLDPVPAPAIASAPAGVAPRAA